jgi:hypothetical protein
MEREKRPKCITQSATPGCATLAEARAELRVLQDAQGVLVSMPAQDHRYNCLQTAVYAVAALCAIRSDCGHRGHDWAYSPFVKLMSPLLRERICMCCRLVEHVPDSDVPRTAKLFDEDKWAHERHKTYQGAP